MAGLTVERLIRVCNRPAIAIPLEVVAGRGGLEKAIAGPEVNRPGLGLTGFFENFAYSRIQIFGKGESAYVESVLERGEDGNLRDFFSYDIACCVYTHNCPVPERLCELAEQNNVTILATSLDSADFIRKIHPLLDDWFAPSVSIHAVLMEVFGVGVLILGKTSIGKSECALELIERGHRLVADDLVEVRRLAGRILIGRGPEKIPPHHMEIRGLGIINISMLFGVGAIRDKKRVQLVVQLELWDSAKEYERTGLDDTDYEILGIRIPQVTVPISPVRNVPVVIETAAMNYRLKKIGFHAAREFDGKLKEIMKNPEIPFVDEDF